MNDLKETIERVRELDAKATKGPIDVWTHEVNGEVSFRLRAPTHRNMAWVSERKDADLLAHYRTAAPKIATACEDLLAENARLRGLIEAAPHAQDCPKFWQAGVAKEVPCLCWKSRALPPEK